jgi:hypothetical protein
MPAKVQKKMYYTNPEKACYNNIIKVIYFELLPEFNRNSKAIHKIMPRVA